MLDLIVAPGIEDKAKEIIYKRKNTKILINPHILKTPVNSKGWHYRFVRGGFLRQPKHSYILDLKNVQLPQGKLSDEEIDSIIIAWACAFSSFHGGNEIAIASARMLLSAGGGPSTVDAAEMSILRAKKYGHILKGAVFACDAFFPFTDAPELLIKENLAAGCAPEGGIKRNEIIDFFSINKVSMLYLKEDIRGFCRH